jgi:hypothetical protein
MSGDINENTSGWVNYRDIFHKTYLHTGLIKQLSYLGGSTFAWDVYYLPNNNQQYSHAAII